MADRDTIGYIHFPGSGNIAHHRRRTHSQTFRDHLIEAFTPGRLGNEVRCDILCRKLGAIIDTT